MPRWGFVTIVLLPSWVPWQRAAVVARRYSETCIRYRGLQHRRSTAARLANRPEGLHAAQGHRMAAQRRPSAPDSGVVRDPVALRISAMTAAPSATIARFGPTSHKKPRSLSANVRSGAIWSFSSTIFLRLSGIGITAIVARLLSPHDFGVFAVATTVFTIVTALGEFGVTSCLARADLDVEALAPTLWSVSLVSSLIMAGVLYKFAGPIAADLGSRDAARPVQVMGLVMVFWGVSAVPTAQCMRDFRQGKLFLANALSFVPSMAVLLFLAKHGSGAMAFAWSRVAGQGISCAVILLSVPKLHLPGMTRGALAVLYKFGVPLACANFVGYILQNVDYALIGRLIGPVMLGTYVLAFNAASWSSTLLVGMLNTVSMPAFSRVKHDAARLRGAMADGVRVVMLIAAPMCTLVMVLSRPIVLTLYGGRWAAAAAVLSILACYGLISVVGVLFSNMLAATGPVEIRAHGSIDMACRTCSRYGDRGAQGWHRGGSNRAHRHHRADRAALLPHCAEACHRCADRPAGEGCFPAFCGRSGSGRPCLAHGFPV